MKDDTISGEIDTIISVKRDIMSSWKSTERRRNASLLLWSASGGSIHLKAEAEREVNIREFYASTAWSNCRRAYRKSVGGLCERCLKHGIIKAGDEVHHKRKLTDENVNDPTISLNWNNLELLCKECHAAEHSTKRFTVDALGRVTPYRK